MLESPLPIPMPNVEHLREYSEHVKVGEVELESWECNTTTPADADEPKHDVVQPEVIEPSLSPTPSPSSPFEELATVDRLFITKRLRVKKALLLCGKKNTFLVKTPDLNALYTISEDNKWWVGYLCYGLRPLQLKVCNSSGVEVMRIDRPYACSSRFLPCQLQSMKVYTPQGELLGSIEQQWTVMKPLYVVKNRSEEIIFWIFGPYITISCFSDVSFTITRADGSPAGATKKRWLGLMHALFFSPITDKFGVAFDMDLTVSEKVLLLAATLLMSYMYYDL